MKVFLEWYTLGCFKKTFFKKIKSGTHHASAFKWLGAALNLVEIKNPFGSVQTNPQADAWWVQVFPNFQRRECICGVQKNRYGHNFQNIASKMNLRWVINYDNPLIHFGTDILIIVAVSVFLYTS